ncbi:ABCC1 [Symbiodinium natans]|uniref:ABCC1 protein n=1 Tax=Symbiodinium natans TaxID=878477 RepID=A0A812VGC8_9DINO|nr:ABCC1 [Symbiodinium natans]
MGRKAKAKATSGAAPAPGPAAEADSTLANLLSTDSRRPRWDETPPLLCTGIVAGYLPGEEELELSQPQLCRDTQSQEIWDTPELLNSPISKFKRREYNWVAASVKGPGHYTMDPTKMQPCAKYSDSRCDICGQGERLFLFRAFERSSAQDPKLRKLHPVLAYFGEVCGKGLLGKRWALCSGTVRASTSWGLTRAAARTGNPSSSASPRSV